MFTIPDARTQARAELAPKPTERFPILSRHWPEFPKRAHRPALRLVSSQPSRVDNIVDEAIERLSWNTYVAAVDAHGHHKTASTHRSRSAALLAWRYAYLLDEHEEVWS